MSGRWVVRLFPPAWRRRYADELVAILELQPPSLRQLMGLLYCALDAHLDPQVTDGGDFSFMEGRPSMRTRLLAAGAVGDGLLLLFGLIITVSDGLVVRLALFYALATVGVIGMHRRQVDQAPALAWIGFAGELITGRPERISHWPRGRLSGRPPPVPDSVYASEGENCGSPLICELVWPPVGTVPHETQRR
jgi:hypothetical protein